MKTNIDYGVMVIYLFKEGTDYEIPEPVMTRYKADLSRLTHTIDDIAKLMEDSNEN